MRECSLLVHSAYDMWYSIVNHRLHMQTVPGVPLSELIQVGSELVPGNNTCWATQDQLHLVAVFSFRISSGVMELAILLEPRNLCCKTARQGGTSSGFCPWQQGQT